MIPAAALPATAAPAATAVSVYQVCGVCVGGGGGDKESHRMFVLLEGFSQTSRFADFFLIRCKLG